MKVSSRERLLVILLCTVAILFGGYKLLIEPSLKSYGTTMADYIKIVEEKEIALNNINKAKTIDEQNNTLEEKINITASPFFPELLSDKMQIWFQAIAEKANISYQTLTLTKPAAVQISNTTSQENALTYPAKDAANKILDINNGLPNTQGSSQSAADSKKPAAQQSKGTPSDTVELMTVIIQFSGSYDQTINFVNEINNSGRYAKIISVSMNIGEQNAITTTINVECYGVKKFNNADPLTQDTLPLPAGKYNPF